MRPGRYAMYVGDARSTASITSFVDGAMLAKRYARERPGVEHTVAIDGLDFASYTLHEDGEMEAWLR